MPASTAMPCTMFCAASRRNGGRFRGPSCGEHEFLEMERLGVGAVAQRGEKHAFARSSHYLNTKSAMMPMSARKKTTVAVNAIGISGRRGARSG